MKRIFLIHICLVLCFSVTNFLHGQTPDIRPKLVVGIVADPMGYDWIAKYWDYFGTGGIKKLVNQGASFENASLDHYLAGTSTSPASLATGASPYQHGIIADSWYNRLRQEEERSTKDYIERTIGSNSQHGRNSARRLLTPTFGDALKNSSSKESKVISISLMANAAVMMAGHLADGCYWFDPSSGNWITSSAYTQSLPDWVVEFNNKSLTDQLISEDWELLLNESEYSQCLPDDQEFEQGLYEGFTEFPYNLQRMKRASLSRDYEVLLNSPAGNTITTDLAIEAINSEKLGNDDDPDLLMVSYSAISGLISHYGPESREVMDAVLRLDIEISRLLTVLEEQLGKDKVLVFFTATHGSSWNVDHASNLGLPSGRFRSRNAIALTNSYLSAIYGENQWIESYLHQQLYLDQTLVDQKKISLPEMQEKAARFLNQFEGVANALPSDRMINTSIVNPEGSIIQNSFYPSRSGDISIVLKPGWIEDGDQVSDFHSPYPYDTRIPLIWWGMDISFSTIQEYVSIQDIAPTLIRILRISFPISGTGKSLLYLIKN